MRCTATSKYTGEQCKKWAVPGTTVCHMHGVTSNGARKAEERVTLAPRSPPTWAIEGPAGMPQARRRGRS
jgi:ADP-ribose pyrophosphatase YjhB (NUDIX family)